MRAKRGRPRAFQDNREKVRIRAVDRAVRILKAVADADGLSLSEIRNASGQPISTAYRVLVTLQEEGLVEFQEASQLWYVGVGAFRIGSSFLRRTSIVERGRPIIQRLMFETGETANLAIVEKGDVVFISQAETHDPIRAFFRPGTRGPIHASGIGKVLLAYGASDLKALDSLFPLTKFTPNTIINKHRLFRELDRIRCRGWAIDDEERTVGMRCVAAPIFNQNGDAVAGVSVSGPSVRMTKSKDDRLGEKVRVAADDITKSVGGRVSPRAKTPVS